MTDRSKLLFILLFLLCLLINLWTIWSWGPSYIVNDGIQYLSTAENWLAGDGFSTHALIYGPHFQGVFPAPQTVWPPGYSVAIALVATPGLELSTAALLLNHLTHALAALLMILIFRRLTVPIGPAITFTFLFYLMAMPWSFVSGLITEPVFTALILATILFLPNPQHSGIFKWIVCGVLVAMSIYIRYSAVFFSVGVSIGLFLYALTSEKLNFNTFMILCGKLAIITGIPALAFTHLMYRTQELIGTLDRYSGTRPPETLLSTLRLWLVNLAELMGFSAGRFFTPQTSTILFLIFSHLIVLIALWFFIDHARRIRLSHRVAPLSYLRIASFVIVFHGISLALYLTISSMSETPLEIVNRYLYQIYSGFYILFCFMIFQLVRRAPTWQTFSAKVILVTILGCLVIFYLLAQLNELVSSRIHFFSEPATASEVMALTVADETSLSSHIKTCLDKTRGDSIWSTHGQHVHLHTGLPTITHADIYTHAPFTPDSITKRIVDYNIRMFVFVETDTRPSNQYTQYMSDLKFWLANNDFSVLQLSKNKVYGDKTVTVYTESDGCPD